MHKRVRNDEVGQNDFISLKFGVQRKFFCVLQSTLDIQTSKLTTTKGEGKPSYLHLKSATPKTYHSSYESLDGSSSSLTNAS
jgi:hypothetical protein